jgi:hypothetical protein
LGGRLEQRDLPAGLREAIDGEHQAMNVLGLCGGGDELGDDLEVRLDALKWRAWDSAKVVKDVLAANRLAIVDRFRQAGTQANEDDGAPFKLPPRFLEGEVGRVVLATRAGIVVFVPL